MKLLFVSWAFPPMKFPRSTQVARLATHSKFSKIIVMGTATNQDASLNKLFTPSKDLEVVPVLRSKAGACFDRYLHKLMPFTLRMPDAEAGWSCQATSQILKSHWMSQIQAIVSFGNPMSDHLIGLKLKKKTNLPWAVHFSDPWADNPFFTDHPFVKSWNEKVEKKVISLADKIFFTSEATLDLVMKKYPAPLRSKAQVLAHAYDKNLFFEIDSTSSSNKKIIRYLGNFYGSRTPQKLLEALQLILTKQTNTDFTVEFVGNVPVTLQESGLFQDLYKAGLVKYQPEVSYTDSLKLMKTADCLLVIDSMADKNIFFPSKLAEYIGADKPILALTPEGTTRDIIEQGNGWSVTPDSPEKIATTLLEVVKQLDTHKTFGNAEFRSQFEAKTVSAVFDKAMDELI